MFQPASPFRRSAAQAARPVLRVALLALACGTLFGAAQAQPMAGHGQGHDQGKDGPRHAMAHRMGPGMAGGPMLSGRLFDGVGASAEQKARIQQIMGKAHDETRQQHQADRALHEQMTAVLSAPQIDAAAAENLRQQLQAHRDGASKRHLQAMLDASAVLTPEQRQKLSEQAKSRRDMMQRHHRERESLAPRS